jgi:hypothetical protein
MPVMTSEQLERLFDQKGIDFARPGFYDSPAFRECGLWPELGLIGMRWSDEMQTKV